MHLSAEDRHLTRPFANEKRKPPAPLITHAGARGRQKKNPLRLARAQAQKVLPPGVENKQGIGAPGLPLDPVQLVLAEGGLRGE